MSQEPHFFSTSRFGSMTPVFLLATLCLGVVSAAPSHNPSLDAVWEEWKTKHKKTYNMVGTRDMSRGDTETVVLVVVRLEFIM